METGRDSPASPRVTRSPALSNTGSTPMLRRLSSVMACTTFFNTDLSTLPSTLAV
jgi:hypothetical protein